MTALNVGQITQVSIIERWGWWRTALKDPSKIGTAPLLIHPGEYQVGYYRTRSKGKPWEPVGIYPDEQGVVSGYRNGEPVQDIPELFLWSCRNPITYEAYVGALEGKPFPDEDTVVAEQVAAAGHNSGEVDEAEELKDQIAAALKGMDAYKTIADDATSARALSLRNRLNELSGQAEKIRVKQKEPHLEASKAVDAKWQPLVKSAKKGADDVRDAIGQWETKKLQEQRKREREAEQARIAAEQAARANEPQADLALAPAPVAAVEAAPAPIKPTYGKAASVSVKIVLQEVTDWQALATYMLAHPDLRDFLTKLAQRALDAGRTNIPGIVVGEEAKVR